MNVLDLPFSSILLIKESVEPDTILMLEDDIKYQNHLGTIHASAQYALAEASSGEILERNFGDWNGAYLPVVRGLKSNIKSQQREDCFRKPLLTQREP